MKSQFVLLGALLAIVGCDTKPVAPGPPPTPTVLAPPPVMQPPVVSQPPVAPAQPPSETVKAEAGVTGKGKDYGGGIITEPVRQYFRVQERVVFEIQLPEAMKYYKAGHDNKAPQTHEEYWKEIIEANNLQGKMPKLPPGHKYVYDPQTEELMVQRPQTMP